MGQHAPQIPADLDFAQIALESALPSPADLKAKAHNPKVKVRILPPLFLSDYRRALLLEGSARLSSLLGLIAAQLVVAGLTAWTPDSASAVVCSDFSNQREAQEAANTRDADGDGIYCEALPREATSWRQRWSH